LTLSCECYFWVYFKVTLKCFTKNILVSDIYFSQQSHVALSTTNCFYFIINNIVPTRPAFVISSEVIFWTFSFELRMIERLAMSRTSKTAIVQNKRKVRCFLFRKLLNDWTRLSGKIKSSSQFNILFLWVDPSQARKNLVDNY
jgi:hypothetical protein